MEQMQLEQAQKLDSMHHAITQSNASVLNPQSWTLDPEPYTQNPEPQI